MVERIDEHASEYGPLPTLFEGTSDAVMVATIDPDRGAVVHTVNESFEETFGWAASEIEGEKATEYLFPASGPPEGWERVRERVIEEGEHAELEGWRETQTGERYFLIQAIPFGADELPIDGAYVIYTDMTDRQELRRERELKRRITRLNEYTSGLEDATTPADAFEITERAAGELYRMREVTAPEGDPAIESAVGPDAALVRGPVETARERDDIVHTREREDEYESLLTAVVSDAVIQVGADTPDAFDEDDVELFELLTRGLGTSMRRIERENQLREERERLEFINRVLRHNLLNGLNVVRARLEMLTPEITGERSVDRLDTAKYRVQNMLDLVQTMRTFMHTVVDDDEHELQPTELRPAIETELQKTRDAHPHAEVVVGELPDVAVEADAMLTEVFDNLLRNAIQHNDKEVPRVVLETEVDPESVTVRVADNGPGIDDDRKEAVFEKGMSGLQRPGSGFGLYLVREIVDSYGGEVTVHDNDPEGSVFVVRLPRPD